MNNRNAENRSELKIFDISIEEINNKFTISLGDLRTEIESAKWDATRRAIGQSLPFASGPWLWPVADATHCTARVNGR